MKRFTLLALGLGLILSLTTTSTPVFAQAAAATAQKKPVGLIDMAHLFKEYRKFGDLRDQLRNDIKGSDEKAKEMAQQLQAMQAKMKEMKEGTADYQQLEAQLIQQSTAFEAYRKTQQKDFLRRESKIYKDVYMEVVEAVGQYASYYNYDVIIRFTRDGVDETDNAQELIQNMNRQVVWHNKGVDITEAVLKYLNQKYGPATAAGTKDTSTN